jgi:hypothetical protein
VTTLIPGYQIARADAEQVLVRHVASLDSQSGYRRTLCRQTIERFLMNVSEPGLPTIVLSEERLLRWMLQDVAGRCVQLAVRRLRLLGAS